MSNSSTDASRACRIVYRVHRPEARQAPRPPGAPGRVLVRVTAAGVTPLDHTILSGGLPPSEAPLILGNEGAGVAEDPGGSSFSAGARVMFTGPYGVSKDEPIVSGSRWCEEDPAPSRTTSMTQLPEVSRLPDLMRKIALTQAGFEPGKTVRAPAIGGAVGNAVTQLAAAQVR